MVLYPDMKPGVFGQLLDKELVCPDGVWISQPWLGTLDSVELAISGFSQTSQATFSCTLRWKPWVQTIFFGDLAPVPSNVLWGFYSHMLLDEGQPLYLETRSSVNSLTKTKWLGYHARFATDQCDFGMWQYYILLQKCLFTLLEIVDIWLHHC